MHKSFPIQTIRIDFESISKKTIKWNAPFVSASNTCCRIVEQLDLVSSRGTHNTWNQFLIVFMWFLGTWSTSRVFTSMYRYLTVKNQYFHIKIALSFFCAFTIKILYIHAESTARRIVRYVIIFLFSKYILVVVLVPKTWKQEKYLY